MATMKQGTIAMIDPSHFQGNSRLAEYANSTPSTQAIWKNEPRMPRISLEAVSPIYRGTHMVVIPQANPIRTRPVYSMMSFWASMISSQPPGKILFILFYFYFKSGDHFFILPKVVT